MRLHASSELLVEPLNRVRGSSFGEAKEREEIVAAFSQTRYDARTARGPCALEGRVGGAGGVGIRRVDEAMEVVTDFRQRVLRRLALKIAQLVHAAPLDRSLGPDEPDGAPHCRSAQMAGRTYTWLAARRIGDADADVPYFARSVAHPG
jgi:hypothetical protein